jgi:AraC-like DNA-binding protein
MLYWLGTFFTGLSFFFGLSLLSRPLQKNFKILGLYMITGGYILFASHLVYSGKMLDYPHFFKTGSLFIYLTGPLFYFFICATFRPNWRFQALDLLHFLPFVLHFFELAPFYSLSGAEKAEMFKAYQQAGSMHAEWGFFSFREHSLIKTALSIGYTLASLYWMWPAVNALRNNRIEKHVRYFLLFLSADVIIRITAVGAKFINYLFAGVFTEDATYLTHVIFFLDSFLISIFLLLFPGFTNINLIQNEIEEFSWTGAFPNAKQITEPFEKEETDFQRNLKQTFEQNYQDIALDVEKIAREMGTSLRQLYRKSRELTGNSPLELLLIFRLENAYKDILENPEKPVNTVIQENGFQSRSQFYRRFQEKYGFKPSELRLHNTNGEDNELPPSE